MHIHKWSKWSVVRVPSYFGDSIVDAQERYCLKCLYVDRKRFDA